MNGCLTVADLAYTAGIVDGEGCVAINVSRNRSSNICYYPYVSVKNTDMVLTGWLLETFGGRVTYASGTNRHKATYTWRLYGRNAHNFLELTLPYLKLKWRQAEIALELQERIECKNVTALSQDETAVRAGLADEIHSLNRRGP